jgi:opacity protein-like surface antigen
MWMVGLLVVVALPARAQNTPQLEVMGGYSYLRSDLSGADLGMHGWQGSVTENLNSWFGGTAEFSGYYATTTPPLGPPDININAHTFLFGPQISYRKNPNFTPFVHVLLGGIHASQGYIGISQPKTDFAAEFGGGVDFKIHKNLAIRVIQADYLATPYLNQWQQNVRFSAGIVLRFGEK